MSWLMCVASHNWPEFSDVLSQGPHIRMEELTKTGITTFVKGSFSARGRSRDLRPISPSECEELMNSIVEKAQGVFLWVILVVKNLVNHLDKRKRMNMKDLQDMVDDLPTEINAFYARIWNNIEPTDKETASRLIRFLAASIDNLE
ncbi:hypothetical protein K458DRAFT_387765 [Lentithecium fluviatile CBS 122367]|uniref:Uncharacterized protein n=1 Tax=Lentithecium fluviatile CBS 122367 TaxID=1168545 RepID=A0A6G1J6G8_9PLEO|nr:hypothetical protein K458DRAFT_387765 [Lentithecium fluviatile CBS 122367]